MSSNTYMMSQREKLLLAKKDRLVLHPDSIQTHVILNKYQATEKRLDQLKTQLSPEQCSINKLEISHNQFTDKKAQMLCQALCSNNSLKSILIGQCRLRNSHLKDICSSIAQSELHVNEVSFKHLRVNKKGADAITQMMQQCKQLQKLGLVECGIDSELMHQICKGISSSSSLEHLDLRRNIFDEKGLEDLLEALKAHMCIKNIIMEGTQIGMKEAQMLAHFFERPDCKIEEFVMKEAEVEADALMQIMEAFFKTNQMRKLNLSKNSLSPQICSILSKVSIKLNHFTSLVLSYCDIDEEGLSQLKEGLIGESTIKYLDLSWNNITGPSGGIDILAEIIQNNDSLEKLLIQHNFLGEQGVKKLVKALKTHKSLKLLDVSANEIGSGGFMAFVELFESNHVLQNLLTRKNCIKGSATSNFPLSLVNNTNLTWLDLKDNQLTEEVGKALVDLLQKNYYIEEIVTDGNSFINQPTKEAIYSECRQNLQIKKFIQPNLQKREDGSSGDGLFKDFYVERLQLKGMSFFRSDFVAKFIQMNKHDLHTLDFTNLYFEEGMSDLTDFIGSQDTKIQSITLKDCKIPDNTLRKLIEDFKKLTSLRELRLIKMNMKEHVNSILGDMHSYKHLQLLDLSDNGITNMREISTMLANNASIQQLILKGNTVETIEDFRYLLMGMTANISLVHLEYDIQQALVDPSFKGVCAQIDTKEIQILNSQMLQNQYIKMNVLPKQVSHRNLNSKIVDMSYTNLQSEGLAATIKYFQNVKVEGRAKDTLILKGCNINDNLAQELVAYLIKIQGLEINELDLSLNQITYEGAQHIGAIFTTDKKIRSINLSHNYKFEAEGFKILMKSLRKNSYLSLLDLSGCHIEMDGVTGWQGILDDLSKNCVLVEIRLAGNKINEEFNTLMQNELNQNKSIGDIIIPTIKQGEDERKRKKEKKKEKERTSRASEVNLGIQTRLETGKASATINLGKIKNKSLFFGDIGSCGKPNVKERKSLSVGKNKKGIVKKLKEEIKHFRHHSSAERKKERDLQSDEENSVAESQESQKSDLGVMNKRIQKLSLRGKNLTSLDFLSKFMRENPNIANIDLGDNPITDKEMQRFTIGIKKNLNIKEIELDGIKHLKDGTKTVIQRELDKNLKIHGMLNQVHDQLDNQRTLNLEKSGIKNVGFLNKFLMGYQNLQILDLNDNRLGNRGAIEIAQLIEQTKTIETLALKNNRIGAKGLQHICSALAVNQSIVNVDLRDNMIEDESLKMLLAMLYRNHTIQQIKYSLNNDHHIEQFEKFQKLSHLPYETIIDELKEDHHHHKITWKEKLCLPLWCWQSFIHDKHEAFRFKYDTKALKVIEEELMGGLTVYLYSASIIYYIIMFICPFLLANECNGGINPIAHFIYVGYSVSAFLFEIFFVLRIQKKVGNANILKFNKWHVMELFMGQIARFDTYLDVCFLSLLLQCEQWNLVIPVSIFAITYCIYPLYNLFTLWNLKVSFNHTLPRIEQNCFLCFIREYMLLGTVLDSFCIQNNTEICKKPLSFGRVMGIWTLMTQDGPQYLIHLLFIFVVHTDISHSELTVVMSLICSTFAIQISIFNCFMCTQNEFDPIALQLELKKRQEEMSRADNKIKKEKDDLKRRVSQAIGPSVNAFNVQQSPQINNKDIKSPAKQGLAARVLASPLATQILSSPIPKLPQISNLLKRSSKKEESASANKPRRISEVIIEEDDEHKHDVNHIPITAGEITTNEDDTKTNINTMPAGKEVHTLSQRRKTLETMRDEVNKQTDSRGILFKKKTEGPQQPKTKTRIKEKDKNTTAEELDSDEEQGAVAATTRRAML